MPGMSPRIKLKKGRPLTGYANTSPVINITAFAATPSIAANPNTAFIATATDTEQGDISGGITWSIASAIVTAGYADATNGSLIGTQATAAAAAVYDFDVTIDGAAAQLLSITTTASITYSAIAALMDTAVVGGSVAYDDAAFAFRVTSDSTGATSTATIAAGTAASAGGDLFAALNTAETVTHTFPAATAGTDQVNAAAGTGANPSITFLVQGVQDVIASVTDAFNVTVTDTVSVTVAA